MPQFTKGKWKYIPVLYQVVSFPEGKEFDIVDGAHVFWDNNAPALWHEITGEINGLNNSDEEAHANGRLIAEAPVMYDLLGKAWDALPDDHPLRYQIDACLCHVEASPVPGEEDY